jgi:hypothetical protein
VSYPSLLLIVGLITGGIAAAIASSRGRSVLGWFVIGALFGFLGVLVVAVLPPPKSGSAATRPSPGRRIAPPDPVPEPEATCPACGETVEAEDDVCPTCGSDLRRRPAGAGSDGRELDVDLTGTPETGLADEVRAAAGRVPGGHLRIGLGERHDLARDSFEAVLRSVIWLAGSRSVRKVTLVGVPGPLRSFARLEVRGADLRLRQEGADLTVFAR